MNKQTNASILLLSVLSLLTICLVGCGKSTNTGTAFTLNNNIAARFEQDEVFINVSDASSCANAGMTTDELLIIIEEAVNRFWNTVPTSRLRLSKGQLINVSSYFETGPLCKDMVYGGASCDADAIPQISSDIVISCNTDNVDNFPAGDGILAKALPINIENQFIRGAVIVINDTAITPFAGLTRDEKISVIAHELGHTLGLGHSPATRALMYYSATYTHAHLSPEDMNGITYLYGKDEKIAGVASCGTIDIDNNGSGGSSNPFNFLITMLGMILIISLLQKTLSTRSACSFKT